LEKKEPKERDDNLQVDNGNFTRIHNKILEELAKMQLSGHEIRIIFALWRKTYGWQKKEEWITPQQFHQLTGLGKTRISEAIRKLKEKNLVTEKRNSNKVMYSFNKHFTTWKKLRKNVTVTEKRNSCYGKSERPLRKSVTKNRQDTSKNEHFRTPKETITKENNNNNNNIRTTNSGIQEIEFGKLTPQQQKEVLDLIVRMHFKKFPYKNSVKSKIYGKNGWIGFRTRVREYFEGILTELPALKPLQIIKAIEEARTEEPWKYYPLSKAREECGDNGGVQSRALNRKPTTKEDWETLIKAKRELEVCSSEEKIYQWLIRLPPSLHGVLAAHLNKVYPDGHSYDKAKIRYERELAKL